MYDMLRRIEVARWIGGKVMTSREEARVRIDRYAAALAVEPRLGAWAVVERASGTVAGTVLLQRLPDSEGEVEIGWHFHPDSWGQGFASEAAGALRLRSISDGLTEVWAVTHLDNDRSIRVCQRMGMRLLGVTDRWYHEPSLMFWAGSREDQRPSLLPDRPSPTT